MKSTIVIRPTSAQDHPAIWAILKPIFRAGDTYTVDKTVTQQRAVEYWTGGNHTSFVVDVAGDILATYYICPNQNGGGDHVCNCGFATSPKAQGMGLARKMLEHALELTPKMNFRAMQFNFVVETNERAVAIWKHCGFEVVGRLPGAFKHPEAGYVDALVMYKNLMDESAAVDSTGKLDPVNR